MMPELPVQLCPFAVVGGESQQGFPTKALRQSAAPDSLFVLRIHHVVGRHTRRLIMQRDRSRSRSPGRG